MRSATGGAGCAAAPSRGGRVARRAPTPPAPPRSGAAGRGNCRRNGRIASNPHQQLLPNCARCHDDDRRKDDQHVPPPRRFRCAAIASRADAPCRALAEQLPALPIVATLRSISPEAHHAGRLALDQTLEVSCIQLNGDRAPGQHAATARTCGTAQQESMAPYTGTVASVTPWWLRSRYWVWALGRRSPVELPRGSGSAVAGGRNGARGVATPEVRGLRTRAPSPAWLQLEGVYRLDEEGSCGCSAAFASPSARRSRDDRQPGDPLRKCGVASCPHDGIAVHHTA